MSNEDFITLTQIRSVVSSFENHTEPCPSASSFDFYFMIATLSFVPIFKPLSFIMTTALSNSTLELLTINSIL